MLTAPQLAKDAAAMECQAFLEQDDQVKEHLADARWSEAAEDIARHTIGAYELALAKGQS
jgi:hypothetical protein